jgi:hypothetical protein
MFERTAQWSALAGEATAFCPPKNDGTNPILPSPAPGPRAGSKFAKRRHAVSNQELPSANQSKTGAANLESCTTT